MTTSDSLPIDRTGGLPPTPHQDKVPALTPGRLVASKGKAASGYAGDVSPLQAFQWWQSGDAVLVDVRTDEEREWVGFVPGAIALPWKTWPGMALNPDFEDGIKAAVPAGKKAVLLCRSGVRSVAAAQCADRLGIAAYNILEGFEGDADQNAHRGNKGGWRLRGLPWQQR